MVSLSPIQDGNSQKAKVSQVGPVTVTTSISYKVYRLLAESAKINLIQRVTCFHTITIDGGV